MNKKEITTFFVDKITNKDFDEDIYNQLAKNIAKTIDIDLGKIPLVDLLTAYTQYKVLEFENKQLEQEKENLIKHLENEINEIKEAGLNNGCYDEYLSGRLDSNEAILERIKEKNKIN